VLTENILLNRPASLGLRVWFQCSGIPFQHYR